MDRLRKALSARSAAHSPRGATRRDNNKYELTQEQRQNQRAAQPTESEVRQQRLRSTSGAAPPPSRNMRTWSNIDREPVTSDSSGNGSNAPGVRLVVGVRIRPLIDRLESGQPLAWEASDTADADTIVEVGTEAERELAEAEQRGIARKFSDANMLSAGGDAGGGASDASGGGTPRGAGRKKVRAKQRFAFAHIFDASVGNEEIYERLAQPVVERCLEGFSGTIMAYGQTGSGKTHTLLGSLGAEDGDSGGAVDVRGSHSRADSAASMTSVESPQPGLIPLLAHDLFDRLAELQEQDHNTQALVRLSYLEIYNEQLRDLLADKTSGSSAAAANRRQQQRGLLGPADRGADEGHGPSRLVIKEDATRGVRVAGLVERLVPNPASVMELIAKGEAERRYGETHMNARSSRSHTVVQLHIECRRSIHPRSALEADGESARAGASIAEPPAPPVGEGGRRPSSSATHVLSAVVHLVDLAGSERVSRTGASGERLREAGSINKSLLTLGTVVSELSKVSREQERRGVGGNAGSDRLRHIRYRDSKLTRLLQPSLGGNCLTAVIATVSPANANREETRNTLNFAARARNVVNRAVPAVEVADQAMNASLLAQYQQEIFMLRSQLAQATAAAAGKGQHGRTASSASSRRQQSARGRIASVTAAMMGNTQTVEALRRIEKLRVTALPPASEEEEALEAESLMRAPSSHELVRRNSVEELEQSQAQLVELKAAMSGLEEELQHEKRLRQEAERRVTELETTLDGAAGGKRDALVEDSAARHAIAEAEARATKAERALAVVKADASSARLEVEQLTRLLQRMQTRYENRERGDALEAEVKSVLQE